MRAIRYRDSSLDNIKSIISFGFNPLCVQLDIEMNPFLPLKKQPEFQSAMRAIRYRAKNMGHFNFSNVVGFNPLCVQLDIESEFVDYAGYVKKVSIRYACN